MLQRFFCKRQKIGVVVEICKYIYWTKPDWVVQVCCTSNLIPILYSTLTVLLVRLWSTYSVRFFLRGRHRRRRRRRHRCRQHLPIEMYDSSNESSQRTE